MLQVIKMPHNDPHKEVKDSIKNSIDNLLADIQDRDVTGFCFVLLEKDGSSTFYESAGLERQRRIGILMDMIYELLRK